MTRHEPAGLFKAAVAETITGSSEPPGDVRLYEGLRPLTHGALVRVSLTRWGSGGLDPVCSPLRLLLPLTVAAESLHPS